MSHHHEVLENCATIDVKYEIWPIIARRFVFMYFFLFENVYSYDVSNSSPLEMRYGDETFFCQEITVVPIILILTPNTYDKWTYAECPSFNDNKFSRSLSIGQSFFLSGLNNNFSKNTWWWLISYLILLRHNIL